MWYQAEILGQDGNKRLVHYKDFSTAFDEWVTVDRIKPRGAPEPTLKAPPAAVATRFEGLYYRSTVLPKDPSLSGGAAIRTFPYWFLPDGHILGGDWNAVMKTYLRSRRVADFQKAYRNSWGTYTIQDETIEITWVGERTESHKLESTAEGPKISGLLKAWQFPKGHTIDGLYLGLEGGGKKDGQTSGTFHYEFGPMQTCRYSELLFVQIGENEAGATSTVNRFTGKYKFDDYALTVTEPDGTRNVFIAWAYGPADAREASPKVINIGGAAYRWQNK